MEKNYQVETRKFTKARKQVERNVCADKQWENKNKNNFFFPSVSDVQTLPGSRA